jgi:hypothetical protein
MQLANSVFLKIGMIATLSTACIPLSIAVAMAESPAMNITEYELNSNRVEDCVMTAETVMKEEGFKDVNISPRDVFASAGDISIEMYCVRDGKTLVLVLAGSNPEDLRKLQRRLDKRLSQ